MTDTDALDAGLLAARDLLARIIDLAFDPANGDKTFAECREEGARMLLAALRSERVRGEESMRERAAKVAEEQIGENIDICGIPCPEHAGDVAAAIRALPTTDQEKTHG